MKKTIIILIALAIAIGIFAIGFFAFKGQTENPSTSIGPSPTIEAVKTGLVVQSPSANQEISSPIKIIGYVNGDGWIGFEGQVGTVELKDSNGNTLATAVLKATTDWTKPPIKFEAVLEFISSSSVSGKLIFNNENPSGLAENSKVFELPVKIAKSLASQSIKVKAYFGNQKLDPESSCNKVFAIEREIPKTQSVGQASIEQLLIGLTQEEKDNGYFTNINEGVKLQKLTIENGIAKADFNDVLEFQAGGSCKVAFIRSQITQTLLQFPTIKQVIISIDGRIDDILQP